MSGMQDVLKRVKLADARLVRLAGQGLKLAGLHLQRESQVIVPVDTGALKNSAYTRAEQTTLTEPPIVRVGYVQSYAVYVHEDLEARHAPGKTAKYLTRPAEEQKRVMIDIIKGEIHNGV